MSWNVKLLSRKHFFCCTGVDTHFHRPSNDSKGPGFQPTVLGHPSLGARTPGVPQPSPALHTRPQRAVAVAARVVVEVHDAGVALLALVHPGVPAHFVAAFLETLLGLAFNGLIDGLFTAV